MGIVPSNMGVRRARRRRPVRQSLLGVPYPEAPDDDEVPGEPEPDAELEASAEPDLGLAEVLEGTVGEVVEWVEAHPEHAAAVAAAELAGKARKGVLAAAESATVPDEDDGEPEG